MRCLLLSAALPTWSFPFWLVQPLLAASLPSPQTVAVITTRLRLAAAVRVVVVAATAAGAAAAAHRPDTPDDF